MAIEGCTLMIIHGKMNVQARIMKVLAGKFA